MVQKKLWVLSTLFFISATGCQTKAHPPKKVTEPTAELKTATQYAKDGLLSEAAHAYRRILLKNPENPRANRNLGIVYVKTGDYHKAIKYLERSLTKYKHDSQTNFYLAEAFRARDQYGKAIYRYNRCLEKKPNHKKAMKALAWSYFQVRFYSEALRVVKKLIKMSPNDAQVNIIAARTLVKVGRLKKAMSTIRRGMALAKKSDLPFLHSVEGDLLYRMRQFEKAEKTYRLALKEQPLLAGALLGLAKCLIKSRSNINQAVEYMERAVRIKPKMTEALYLLGKYYEDKDPSKSKRFFKNFKRYASTDPEFQRELAEIRGLNFNNQRKPPPKVFESQKKIR